jgi:hypothetical protein
MKKWYTIKRTCSFPSSQYWPCCSKISQHAFHLPRWGPDTITHVFRFLCVANTVQQFLDGHVDFAYVSVSEVSFRLALDDEGEVVLLGGDAIDSEFHGEVPFGVRAAVFVCGCGATCAPRIR